MDANALSFLVLGLSLIDFYPLLLPSVSGWNLNLLIEGSNIIVFRVRSNFFFLVHFSIRKREIIFWWEIPKMMVSFQNRVKLAQRVFNKTAFIYIYKDYK